MKYKVIIVLIAGILQNQHEKRFIDRIIAFMATSLLYQINTERICFELRYPVPMGDNFINKELRSGYCRTAG